MRDNSYIFYFSTSLFIQVATSSQIQPYSNYPHIVRPNTMDSSKVHTSTTDDSIANQLSNSVQSIPRAYTEGFWPVTNNGELFGMIAAACVLLLFYALLAGLTLAVCGLDLTWLHMRLITGTSKQRFTFYVGLYIVSLYSIGTESVLLPS